MWRDQTFGGEVSRARDTLEDERREGLQTAIEDAELPGRHRKTPTVVAVAHRRRENLSGEQIPLTQWEE